MRPLPDLPVSTVLPELLDALGTVGRAVLVAPPGAGKTTLVPIALLDAAWRADGAILLLEPRRLAARAAARRMAALLGEDVGRTVGYAMRMDSRTSAATRILVVTEGVLARMILDDPELPGIAAILFDEFHERSLDADFGLALALDVRDGFRPDLRLVVMSATLDGARVARLLDGAPVVTSTGRAFPVELRHRDRAGTEAIEDAVAATIRETLATRPGSILAFLPGQREIERTAERLAGRIGADVDVTPLYGQLDGKAQDAAIRPAAAGRRKVVLATAIAETSITIDGVTVVIDSGLARLPKYEPSTGLTRLETVRVSRAAADQRAGRAGRTGPGIAIRLWRAEQTAALPAHAPPEIMEADLSSLVLDCAAFGVADPATLRLLDQPPAPALAEARALLRELGAIDADGRLTPDGKAMRGLSLPVRLAHMVARAAMTGDAHDAALLAVLATERGLGGDGADLDRRLSRLRTERGPRAEAARQLAGRLARSATAYAPHPHPARGEREASTPETPSSRPSRGEGKGEGQHTPFTPGALLVHAYPDRVAKARGERGRFVLANGRGAVIDAADPLAAEAFLVIADLQGKASGARIASAAAISESDLRAAMAARITRTVSASFERAAGAVRARETERLGAIVLSERTLPAPAGPEADRLILEAVRAEGVSILPWTREVSTFRARLAWLHRALGEPWPDVSDDSLVAQIDDWLAPFLTGEPTLSRLRPDALHDALMSLVPHDLQRRIGDFAPTHFDAPSGSHVPIRYEDDQPVLAIRVQELFGLSRHPSIAGGKVPLTLELLSPAHRPIQTTRDLPGFWRGSWAEVRSEMRGRYPRHVWPDDPASAQATARAKPRGT